MRSWWRCRGSWSRRSRRGRACASRSVASSSSSRSSRKDTSLTSTSSASSPDRLRFEIELDQETGPQFFDRSLRCYWAGSVPHREEASAEYVSDDPGLKLINGELRLQPHQDVGSVVLAVEQKGNHPSLTCYLYGKTIRSLLLKELPFLTGGN